MDGIYNRCNLTRAHICNPFISINYYYLTIAITNTKVDIDGLWFMFYSYENLWIELD